MQVDNHCEKWGKLMADDKITSIAGLKKAIKGTVWVGVGTTEDILRVIGEFEASVKARRDEWKKIDASVKWHYSKKREHAGRILELMRILGDGGGHD